MVKALQSSSEGGTGGIWLCRELPGVSLALQAQLSHPWGEGSPFAHCYAGLISLWLLRGLFLN